MHTGKGKQKKTHFLNFFVLRDNADKNRKRNRKKLRADFLRGVALLARRAVWSLCMGFAQYASGSLTSSDYTARASSQQPMAGGVGKRAAGRGENKLHRAHACTEE